MGVVQMGVDPCGDFLHVVTREQTNALFYKIHIVGCNPCHSTSHKLASMLSLISGCCLSPVLVWDGIDPIISFVKKWVNRGALNLCRPCCFERSNAVILANHVPSIPCPVIYIYAFWGILKKHPLPQNTMPMMQYYMKETTDLFSMQSSDIGLYFTRFNVLQVLEMCSKLIIAARHFCIQVQRGNGWIFETTEQYLMFTCAQGRLRPKIPHFLVRDGFACQCLILILGVDIQTLQSKTK